MIEYISTYYMKLLTVLWEHIYLFLVTIFFGVLISLIIGFIIYNIPKLSTIVTIILQIIYTIPSLAFFAILIPITGTKNKTAIIVLVAYTLFFLVRSFLEGLNGINSEIVDAGRAMGYSTLNLFIKVQLPLCMPSILNGIRLASISTIGITCIAYTIGAGGIGSILFEGMRQNSFVKILTGAIMVVVLNITINSLLLWVEKVYIEKMHLND